MIVTVDDRYDEGSLHVLRSELGLLLEGVEVEVVASTPSTNAALLDAGWSADPAGPRLFVADHQTAGRGRRGRVWVSDAHTSLTCSMAFERDLGFRDAPAVGLSVAVGVALAGALQHHVSDLRVKWPNDLVRSTGKCGGILIEARRQGARERVVIGVGLNVYPDARRESTVDQPLAALFPAPSPQATSGRVGIVDPDDGPSIEPRAFDLVAATRRALIVRVAQALQGAWSQFLLDGLGDTARRWAQFDALADQSVVVMDHGRVVLEGEARGIDSSGALCVATPGGLRLVTVGDVSVRVRKPAHADPLPPDVLRDEPRQEAAG